MTGAIYGSRPDYFFDAHDLTHFQSFHTCWTK